MTGPPTVHGRDLNTGPLNFEESALLTELTMAVYQQEVSIGPPVQNDKSTDKRVIQGVLSQHITLHGISYSVCSDSDLI